MKNLLFTAFIFMVAQISFGQQLYCDFEGTKVITFGMSTGVMDSLVLNPATNIINSSGHCAKYIRDTTTYDNFKLYPDTLLEDVTPYAANNVTTPKITMKLYSTAQVGTVVQLQLGLKSDDNYPTGVHSEYSALTTAQNAWQNITFDYVQSPVGSLALPTQIDKIVILFHPNSSARDTIYIDDLSGPRQLNFQVGIPTNNIAPALKLYQNSPNPAVESTHINFQLGSAGMVTLKLYDLLGNTISSVLEQNMKMGTYSIPVRTENIPNGIYFCVLEKEGISQSIKMIVSK